MSSAVPSCICTAGAATAYAGNRACTLFWPPHQKPSTIFTRHCPLPAPLSHCSLTVFPLSLFAYVINCHEFDQFNTDSQLTIHLDQDTSPLLHSLPQSSRQHMLIPLSWSHQRCSPRLTCFPCYCTHSYHGLLVALRRPTLMLLRLLAGFRALAFLCWAGIPRIIQSI